MNGSLRSKQAAQMYGPSVPNQIAITQISQGLVKSLCPRQREREGGGAMLRTPSSPSLRRLLVSSRAVHHQATFAPRGARLSQATIVPPISVMRTVAPLCTTQRQRLPTIDDIRKFGPHDLESALLDLNSAVSVLSPLMESTLPRRGELLRLLAVTHIRLGAYLYAEDCLLEAMNIEDQFSATKAYPTDGGAARREIRFLLGVCYQKTAREENARRAFKAVLEEDPEHWRAKFHVALFHMAAEEWDTAETLLCEVLAHEPDHPTASGLIEMLRERQLAEANQLKPEGPP